MSRIPAHIIDEIMNTARIEEVIMDYVQLKKSGSNYKGKSPFVEEKTPSFMVSPAKQIFKDFSSGKGGTVVSFLMEIEQFSYPEALRWLADRYNIVIPETKPLTPEEQIELSERESLQIVNSYARDYFVEILLKSEEGRNIGLSYFKEREFRLDTIEKFQLGYCPREEKSLTESAIEKGYKLEYLETLGLTKTKDDRRFDFFSGRVIFPIHSVSGKVLGFGGRTLSSSTKVAKYFNSPESILYDKSRILYGMYFAKQEIVKQNNCFLVEGYADVISMSQAGIENVVASSGTALTKGQIKLIQRYTNNITVLYDSDPAGIKASFRGIDLLLEEGMTVKVLLFPEGDDPDSFARRVSSDELKQYIEKHQQDFVSFKTEILLDGTDNDPIKRAELIKEIVTSIALIPDAITRSVYVKQTASQFDFGEQMLMNELNKIRRFNQNEQARRQQTTPPPQEIDFYLPEIQSQTKTEKKPEYFAQERDLLRILLLYGDRAIEIENEASENESEENNQNEKNEISVAELIVLEIGRDNLRFNLPLFQDIYEQYKTALIEGYFLEADMLLRNENNEIVQFMTDILTSKYEVSEHWEEKYRIEITEEVHKIPQAVKESLYSFKNAIITKQIHELQERLKEANKLPEEEVQNILLDQMLLEKIRRRFVGDLNRIILRT